MDATRLSGWKKIASFLGRDVRTAQNWERERALPIRRIPGSTGASVFAYTDELRAWLDGRLPASPLDATQGAPGLLVLPFEHRSIGASQEFVADGLAQELIGRLATASLSSVRVMSWTTSKACAQQGQPAQALARDLAVRYLVEGALLAAVDRWTIDIRVVDARADRVVLAERFGCAAREILELQSTIAQAICEHLCLHLSGDLAEPMWTRETDPRAFLHFLDGVRHVARGTEEALAHALPALDRAIALDPGLAPARAYKGLALMQSDHHVGWLRPERQHEIRELSACCDAQAPGLVSSAVLGALIARNDCDWERVDRRLAAAMAGNPSSVPIRVQLAGNLTVRRRFDEAQRVLGPLEGIERSLDTDKAIAANLLWSRDFDRAIGRFDAMLRAEPSHVYASMMRFMASVYAGDAAGVRRHRDAMVPALGRAYREFVSGCAAITEGRRAEACLHREAVNQSAARSELAWYHVAMLDGLLGDAAGAATHLSRSLATHEATSSLCAVDPSFDRVRGDRRFGDVVCSIGLPS